MHFHFSPFYNDVISGVITRGSQGFASLKNSTEEYRREDCDSKEKRKETQMGRILIERDNLLQE